MDAISRAKRELELGEEGLATARKVYYTADLVTPDGSDLWNGEPCEPGTGAIVSNGWYDPDWCRTEVREERENVRPDIFDPADGIDPAVWLAYTINQRLSGWPEYHGHGEIWYSGHEDEPDAYSGVKVTVAAHAEGFTDAEIRQAADLLEMLRKDGGWAILDRLYCGDLMSREEWESWNV